MAMAEVRGDGMKVLAFGCTHFATPNTQVLLFDKHINYDNFTKLQKIMNNDFFDVIVNLGDYWEAYYDTIKDIESYYPIRNIPFMSAIKGNHDKYGYLFVEIDGIRYEHGHNNKCSNGLKEARIIYKDKKVVHAHTHEPKEAWALDVGSITFTGTFGIIENGIPKLEYV
jgi:predicted phosphodiesterase